MIEIGREAGTPLADRMSSTMPWNIARGSSTQPIGSRVPFSAGGYASSSVGGPIGPWGQRGSSTVAPSPLTGRDLADLNTAHGLDVAEGLDIDDYQLPPVEDEDNIAQEAVHPSQAAEYEHFGVSAAVDTQTAGAAAWMRQALDSESNNFLSFVAAAIQEETDARAAEDAAGGDVVAGETSIDFDTLLPPTSNTNVVGAQGFLHVLSLATKNLLHVTQEDAFGPIGLRLV